MNDNAWITSAEWLTVVREDAELQIISDSEPYPVEWLRDPSDSGTCFEWDEGNIFVKNPTKQAIIKMEALAIHLRAKVQGDDGEIYRGGEVQTERSA
jgi:hypothetical protein